MWTKIKCSIAGNHPWVLSSFTFFCNVYLSMGIKQMAKCYDKKCSYLIPSWFHTIPLKTNKDTIIRNKIERKVRRVQDCTLGRCMRFIADITDKMSPSRNPYLNTSNFKKCKHEFIRKWQITLFNIKNPNLEFPSISGYDWEVYQKHKITIVPKNALPWCSHWNIMT